MVCRAAESKPNKTIIVTATVFALNAASVAGVALASCSSSAAGVFHAFSDVAPASSTAIFSVAPCVCLRVAAGTIRDAFSTASVARDQVVENAHGAGVVGHAVAVSMISSSENFVWPLRAAPGH